MQSQTTTVLIDYLTLYTIAAKDLIGGCRKWAEVHFRDWARPLGWLSVMTGCRGMREANHLIPRYVVISDAPAICAVACRTGRVYIVGVNHIKLTWMGLMSCNFRHICLSVCLSLCLYAWLFACFACNQYHVVLGLTVSVSICQSVCLFVFRWLFLNSSFHSPPSSVISLVHYH